MANNWSDIPRKINGRGIDTYSARGNISEGFSEYLQNVDCYSEGKISTRKGYQGYAGWVPLRATKVTHSGTDISLQFDSSQSITLANAGQGPLIVSGKVPAKDAPMGGYMGDFGTTFQSHYYPHYSLDSRTFLTVGSNTITKTQEQTGISTPYVFVGMALLPGTTTTNQTLLLDSVDIDSATLEIEIEATATEPEAASFFFKERPVEAGVTYVSSVSAQTSVTINAATHSLASFNILVKCYDTDTSAGHLLEVIPDTVSLDQSSGSVTVTFDTAFTGDIILTTAPIDNKVVAAPTTGMNSITFNAATPFGFFAIYELVSGTTITEITPDSINYNSATGEVTIGYFVAGVASTVELYWIEADYLSNIIVVQDTDNVSENWTTIDPEITVWGISHEGIYRQAEDEGGHVNHIDTYKTTSEERLVCGLGGNLFSAQGPVAASAYTFPDLLYMLAEDRISANFSLAPLFQPQGSTTLRTRGIVTDTSIVDNKAIITSATYISSGVVDYTFSFVNKTGSVAVGSTISLQDKLYVSGLAFSQHTGSWDILSVQSDSSTETVIRVSNPNVVSANYNEVSAQGRGGVFTDKLEVTASDTSFIAGDILVSAVATLPVSYAYEDEVYVTLEEDDSWAFPLGVSIFVRRTSRVIPLGTSAGTPSVENLVRGDMLSLSTQGNLSRVLDVNTADSEALTITVVDGVATAEGTNPLYLNTGSTYFLFQGSVSSFNGEIVVEEVLSPTEFTFNTTSLVGGSAMLLGKTVTIDEVVTSEDGLDGLSVGVEERWIPIEAPSTAYDLPPDTYTRYFVANSYSTQPILRSTMTRDTMFFTNLDDEVMKFDGENIYRAGLVRWQPALFVQLNTTGSLVTSGSSAAYTDKSQTEKWFEVPLSSPFQVGDRIEDDGDGAVYTVLEITDDGTNKYVYVDRAIVESGTTGTISQVSRYRYYARLNAVDRNGNITASAVTSSQDLVVEFASAKQPRLRFVGMPAFNNYDYDTIELEVYRTKANENVFYLASRQLVPFNNNAGYIDVYDGTPDDALQDTDLVVQALMGNELGTGWDAPLRARYITSVDNRLILANLKGYPSLTTQMVLKPEQVSVTAASLDGVSFLLRKDNTDAGTTANSSTRFKYEYVDSGAYTISGLADSTGNTSVTLSAPLSEDVDAGSWVYLYHATPGTDNDLSFAGWYQVVADAVATDSVVIISAPFVSASNPVDRLIFISGETSAVPVFVGTDGNYNTVEGNTSGSYEGVAALRLANAINASMRQVDVTLPGQEDFSPFVAAYAGNDYALGVVSLSKPFVDGLTPEWVATLTGSDLFNYYVDDIQQATSSTNQFATLLFPSRMLRSYPNYPEIFDNPAATQSELSTSVINLNESDGQACTGAIPFFGESTFGAANLGQIVIATKERSIYAYDVVQDALQKLDSRGLGSTAGFATAPTKDGIMFVNASGVYKIQKDLSIGYAGKALQRLWKSVNLNQLASFTGHHYPIDRQYKLSYASPGSLVNDRVFVYNADSEGENQEWGGWTVYTNHPVTGWANKGASAYFATSTGQVMSIRNLNDATDYRDDADAIAEQIILLRPEDFDLPGTKKIIKNIITQLDLDLTDVEGLDLYTAVDLSDAFEYAGRVTIDKTINPSAVYRASLPQRNSTHIQAKYVYNGKDSAIILTVVSYRVTAQNEKGIKEAAKFNG